MGSWDLFEVVWWAKGVGGGVSEEREGGGRE